MAAPPFTKKPPADEAPNAKPAAGDPDMADEGAAEQAGDAKEQVKAGIDASQTNREAAIGKMAPTPTEPIRVDDIVQLVGALNDAMGFLSDGKVPPVPYEPPSKLGVTKEPLPPDVFTYLVAAGQLLTAMAPAVPAAAPLAFDPTVDAATPAGINEMAQKLAQVAESPDIKAAITSSLSKEGAAPAAGPSGEPAPAPMPT